MTSKTYIKKPVAVKRLKPGLQIVSVVGLGSVLKAVKLKGKNK